MSKNSLYFSLCVYSSCLIQDFIRNNNFNKLSEKVLKQFIKNVYTHGWCSHIDQLEDVAFISEQNLLYNGYYAVLLDRYGYQIVHSYFEEIIKKKPEFAQYLIEFFS